RPRARCRRAAPALATRPTGEASPRSKQRPSPRRERIPTGTWMTRVPVRGKEKRARSHPPGGDVARTFRLASVRGLRRPKERILRHSYIDCPRRIRAPRATPRSRTRFLPAVVALPVVAVLWVTVGLPVLSQVTGASGGNRIARDVLFATQANGAGGGAGAGSAVPQTEAAAIVSHQVLAAYPAEVAKRLQARTSAATKAKAKLTKLGLPQLTLTAPTPDTATLATADSPQAPASPRTDTAAPAKDSSPGTGAGGSGSGSGSGSGDSGGAGSSSGGGSAGTSTPPGRDSGGTGDADGSGAGGSGAGGSDAGGAAGTGRAGPAGD